MPGVCTWHDIPPCNQPDPDINPEPDIAGIGVIISFTMMCGISIIASVVAMFFVPDSQFTSHPVDNWCRNQYLKLRFRPLRTLSEERREYWFAFIEAVILSLADLQLLTGIGMLTAGYILCSISVYHASIVLDLAFFASATQLSTLSVVKHHLLKFPILRAFKLVILCTLATLLLSMAILQGNKNWYDDPRQPAYCLFVNSAHDFGGEPAEWMITLIVLLGLGVISAVLCILPSTRRWMGTVNPLHVLRPRNVRPAVVFAIRAPLEGVRAGHTILGYLLLPFILLMELLLVFLLPPLIILWVALWIYYKTIDSYIGNTLLGTAWFGYALWNLIADRVEGRKYMGDADISEEDEWGFGQILPVVLLLVPILSAWQAWYPLYHEAREEDEKIARVRRREEEGTEKVGAGAEVEVSQEVDRSRSV